MERWLKLTVAYDGTNYCGFQRQLHDPTIQAELERAASHLARSSVTVTGAGRTDAGVHARGQVVSFCATISICSQRVPYAFNSQLPPDIVVTYADQVEPGFCARRRAKDKMYRYRILRSPQLCPLRRNYVWHCPGALDVDSMIELARQIEGRRDFRALSRAGSSVATTVRTVREISVRVIDDELWIDVTADGFLYAMVRLIVGTLVDVGRGRLTVSDVMRAVTEGRRGDAGATAPPQGLCLERVTY